LNHHSLSTRLPSDSQFTLRIRYKQGMAFPSSIGLVSILVLLLSIAAGAEPPGPGNAPGGREMGSGVVPRSAGVPTRLREGTILVMVDGPITHNVDGEEGWVFSHVVRGPTTEYTWQLNILPNRYRDELALLTGNPGGRIFEITGRVFLFHSRHYLLLSQPAVPVSGPLVEAPLPLSALATNENHLPRIVEAETTDDIIHHLQRKVGTVARRTSATTQGSQLRRTNREEGSLLVYRRGQVRRTSSGGYLFVFSTDVGGLEDPPMVLLPCMLLEKLERHARRQGGNLSILLSGEVCTSSGEDYLLPTDFLRTNDRHPIRP